MDATGAAAEAAPQKSDPLAAVSPGVAATKTEKDRVQVGHWKPLYWNKNKLAFTDAAPVELWSTPFLALSINPQVDFFLAI